MQRGLIIYFVIELIASNTNDVCVQLNINPELVMEDEVIIECRRDLDSPYLPTSPDDPQIFTKIDPNLSLYFVLHGWTENYDVPYIRQIASELLFRTPSSVCIVDYRTLVKNDILTSECHAVLIGRYLATFIKYLQSKGLPTNKVNLVAHSLGCKVATTVGQTLGVRQLGAIYALDPAAPGLLPNNAIYTQCVFTAFGLFRPEVGDCHANFYINGGVEQPVCRNATNFYCSHQMSHSYFLYSLDPRYKFKGKGCFIDIFGIFCLWETEDMIGIYTQRRNGKFDCQTIDDPPYVVES